jgi:glycosidase
MLRLVLLLASIASVQALANPNVNRDHSRLSIDWYSQSNGMWELKDSDGNLCANGRMHAGRNILEFPKVAAPTNLRFNTIDADLKDVRISTPIPGISKVSPLKKPTGSAVVYQLPPRTYLAKGPGEHNSGQFSDLTDERLADIKSLGVDYLWLTGILEHADLKQTDPDIVKGEAGSYYAIYDNWDVSSHSGKIRDFEALIERAHRADLRVLIDFVPNHTARVHRTDVLCKQHIDFGQNDRTTEFFNPQNNYFYIGDTFIPPHRIGSPGADGIFDTNIFIPGIQLESPARVTGNDITSQSPQNNDWFETVKLNYGWDFRGRQGTYDPMPSTWHHMLDVARYWVKKGVDGFRVDYAHAVPMEFWRHFSVELHKEHPDIFLLAEAYEKDERMKVPGFSYEAILDAGFDSVYNSYVYWALHDEASNPGNMQKANAYNSAAMREGIVRKGYMLTHYMENHDEVRLASTKFARWISDRSVRAYLGLAYTTYAALLPGHFLLHGGQELQEDASVYGNYAGDNGRTSIFDFVYQSQTRAYLYGSTPNWMASFRDRYKQLIALKHQAPFNLRHSLKEPSFVDLLGANWYKDQANHIGAYIRFGENKRYLVVTNSDPFNSHRATIHFTSQEGQDHLGALKALNVKNDDTRYQFREVFSKPGWVPVDPGVEGEGFPGWSLYRSGNVPSGLFLGDIPAGTTLVFEVQEL